jgi:hypothetical protein
LNISPLSSAPRHAAVVAVDVAHAHLGHLAIAFLHLAHDPFQRDDRLLGVGHDGAQEMRDAVIDAEFQHLRVDHDQPAFLGRQLVEQAQDHGVDRHRFARPGGARDQEVGHLGEVGDHRVAADILAQRQRQAHASRRRSRGAQDLAQHHLLAVLVGQFDPDHGPARHGGHPRD